MAISFKFKSHAAEVLTAFDDACNRALERCGLQADEYAQDLCPVDTGALRNSISHKVMEDEKTVYVGTNQEYAPYVELGTGIYYPGGRPTPWAYQDAQGHWHMTHGQRAKAFIKPAVADHAGTYINIIRDEMKNG